MATDVQYAAEATYYRSRYALAKRNVATLSDIFDLSSNEVRTVLGPAIALDRAYYAGYARRTLPAILDKWGNVAGTAAMRHYEAARDAWTIAHSYRDTVGVYTAEGPYTITRLGNNIRRERNFATAAVRGRIYQARIATMNPAELANSVIDQAMAAWVRSGPLAGTDAAANAMTRQVGAYYRDTMLYNAGLDSAVAGVQRVVNPNGCAWCKTLAVGGVGRARAVVLDYAAHFHDHCKCTIETLFAGDKPLRPDYYDDIENELVNARAGNYDDDGMRSLRPDASTNETMRELVQAVRAVERTT
jgi:hypothetical protein